MNTGSSASPITPKRLLLRGLFPATLTPFKEDYSLDLPGLRKHLGDVASTPGVSGIAINAALGEVLQLSLAEQVQVTREAAQACKPGQLVIAGVCSNGAKQAIETAQAVKAAGAHALLVFPPFDTRTYRRLIAHTPSVVAFFRELGETVDLPLVIFQYPLTSGCAYSVETLNALAELPHVVGIKAAPGTMAAYMPTWDALRDKLSVLAAWDGPVLVEKLEYGAHGALIGISNIAPELWVELLDATSKHDAQRVRTVFARCAPIMSSVWENHQPTRITSEVSATKEALVQMGMFPSSRVRPPLLEVTDKVRAEIREGLIQAGLLDTAAKPRAAQTTVAA